MSQEFSRTENRILGALGRLDYFLTNSLIQGHSGTAPETSRNIFSKSQGTNEGGSQSNPHPEAGLFNNQMTQNSSPEVGHDRVTGATEQIWNCHDITGVHEEVTYCSLVHVQESRKRTAPQVNRNSALKTYLRRLRQTKVFWRFRSWQTTTFLQFSMTILTEFPKCQSHLRQRCPRSMENLKKSSCLKISSKQVSKIITS